MDVVYFIKVLWCVRIPPRAARARGETLTFDLTVVCGRTTAASMGAFLDAFQKVADLANNSHGV